MEILVAMFLVLGIIAFSVIIGAAMGQKVRLTILVFGLVWWQAGHWIAPPAPMLVAVVCSAAYLAALLRWGTWDERQAAKRAPTP